MNCQAHACIFLYCILYYRNFVFEIRNAYLYFKYIIISSRCIWNTAQHCRQPIVLLSDCLRSINYDIRSHPDAYVQKKHKFFLYNSNCAPTSNSTFHVYIFTSSIALRFRFYPRDVVSGVFATATWLAGWVAVRHTPVLHQTAKPI